MCLKKRTFIYIEMEYVVDLEGDSGAVRLCYRMMSRTQSEECPESPLKKNSSSGLSNKFPETIKEEESPEQETEKTLNVPRSETETSAGSVFDHSDTGISVDDNKSMNDKCHNSQDTLASFDNVFIHIKSNGFDKSIDSKHFEHVTFQEELIVPESTARLKSSLLRNTTESAHRHSDTSLLKPPNLNFHRLSDATANAQFLNSKFQKRSSTFGSFLNLITIKRKSTDCHKDDDYWIKEYNCLDLFLALASIGFFLADVVSDWRLAGIYYFDNQMSLFVLTVVFIVVPSLISAIITVIWSAMDHQVYKAHINDQKSRHIRRSNTIGDNILLVLKVVFSVFQLGRCFRSFVFIVYVIRSWCTPVEQTRKLHILKKKALEQKHDAAILGLVDGFLESSSQVLLQLYVSISYRKKMDFLRIATICLSFVSAALLQTAFYKNNRKVQKYKPNVGFRGGAVYFLWRLCELGPRFYLLVLFTYCFQYWVIIPTVVQLLVVFALFLYQKPKLKGICCTPTFDYLFCLLVSYIGIFCFVNLKGGKSRYSSIFYYIIYYVGNATMVVLVVFFSSKLEHNNAEIWKSGLLFLIPQQSCLQKL